MDDIIPYTCPVCQGRGLVPIGFYNPGNETLSSSTMPERCRSCNGTGVLWRLTSLKFNNEEII